MYCVYVCMYAYMYFMYACINKMLCTELSFFIWVMISVNKQVNRLPTFSYIQHRVHASMSVSTRSQMKASVTGFPLGTGNKSKGLAN